MDRGYVKLYRKSIDGGWLSNHKLWCFWCWCLLKASHKQTKCLVGFQSVTLEPGQFVFGRKQAAKELDVGEQVIRTCISNLQNMGNITIKSTNKYSIISITNWETYQENGSTTNQQNNQQLTNNQPSTNHQLTTNKNVKNLRKKLNRKEVSSSLLSAPKIGAGNGNGKSPSEDLEPFYLTRKKRKLTGKRLETFNRFWKAFGYPKGKAEAADAWLDIPMLTNALVEIIILAAEREALERPGLIAQGKTPKMAQGWITGRRWEDETVVATEETYESRFGDF